MRIAFVSQYSVEDRSAVSGSAYQVLEMVRATGADVEVISPIMSRWRFLAMRAASLPHRLRGRGMAWPKHPFLLKSYARRVDAAVGRLKPDLVFSPGTNVIAYSGFLRPTVFWSDAPFAAMADYYPWPQYQRLSVRSREYGMAADTRALQQCSAAIYRSGWARQQAIDRHGADPAKVHVLPLPGNVHHASTLGETLATVPQRLASPWRILFSGVDWVRKGGDRTLAILNELVAQGQACELDVVGVQPPGSALSTARFPVRVHPRQDLNTTADRELLLRLTHSATFVVVPSIAETFGFVYCEALNAGVPSVASNTGGVPDILSEGRTGLLIEPDEPPAAIASRLREAGRPERYTAMAQACWQEWQDRFSPAVVVRRLAPLLERAVDRR